MTATQKLLTLYTLAMGLVEPATAHSSDAKCLPVVRGCAGVCPELEYAGCAEAEEGCVFDRLNCAGPSENEDCIIFIACLYKPAP